MIVLMTREKKQLDELRSRFPDTLGAILDRLYDAEAERLRKLKNAGIYGGSGSGLGVGVYGCHASLDTANPTP